MYFDVRIPYEPGRQLGFAYNRCMESVKDWVLFMDQDLFICNPHWYDICLNAINEVGHKAGWITCKTNRILCKQQKQPLEEGQDTDNVLDHIKISRKLWEEHGNSIVDIGKAGNFSGFFMLTHKKAWEDVGGFIDGFSKVDVTYSKRLRAAGYKRYVLPGLYVYHLYKYKWNTVWKW